MRHQGLKFKVTRARPTSNMMFSAAAIAVVSEVNPDEPGASFFHPALNLLFFILLVTLLFPASSQAAPPTMQTAMHSAAYNNNQVQLTPMLFHHIELGMTYEAVVNTVGKSALYCDSGESSCNANNGAIAKSCLESEFMQPNKTWLCHWNGVRSSRNTNSRLEVWFVGVRSAQVVAVMPDGNIYRRDSANTVAVEQNNLR